MSTQDFAFTTTICALATAPGGALHIIRMSGPQSLEIVGKIIDKPTDRWQPNSLHYAHVLDHGQVLDEVVVSCYKAPHSYTGEDCCEISCHGSTYIAHRLLQVLADNGATMAQPGEFTQRAFLNGKLDLSQAEAVADLIASKSKAAHRMAMNQLRGRFSSELQQLREQLLRLTSLLELELDFSDHEDLEFADRNDLLQLATAIDCHISRLAMSYKAGQAIKEGIAVAIVGETNVGKSTLLNRLLKENRAIVSDIHGTTRDTIEDTTQIGGLTFRFIDTAGLRQTDDAIEQIGIQRTHEAIRRASIVIWLTDERPANRQIDEMYTLTADKTLIVVQNKTDLLKDNSLPACQKPEAWTCPMHFISAKTGEGIEALEQAICQAAQIPDLAPDQTIISSARHYHALVHAQDSLQRVVNGLANPTPIVTNDLIAEDLRIVLQDLAEITGGQITPQETLNNIFSHFCVGK